MLEGMRIVSFCHCLEARQGENLADMGADVIKVGRPRARSTPLGRRQGVHRRGVGLLSRGQPRRARVAVDLKHPDGKGMIPACSSGRRAHREFPARRLDRLGLGYEQVKAVRPDIIYASATGFGSSGPMAEGRARTS